MGVRFSQTALVPPIRIIIFGDGWIIEPLAHIGYQRPSLYYPFGLLLFLGWYSTRWRELVVVSGVYILQLLRSSYLP